LNRATRCVVLPAGARLDFGGIAKGMAVDAALKMLRDAGIVSALVNAGGDLAVLGLPPQNEDWPVSVPLKDDTRMVPLHHGAIATSGIARRRWSQGTELRHHLLDPRVGLSASSGLWSVTVVAARCEQAEVAAKVAFVLGIEEGSAFLEHHQLPGLLVASDSTWHMVGPWPK
jgi:thiamine biosynthesis lipoprotein